MTKTMSQNEIQNWADEIAQDVENLTSAIHEANDSQEQVRHAANDLKRTLRHAPHGASNASCWDWLEEMADLEPEEIECSMDALDDDDRDDLVKCCKPPVEFHAGMTGAELAEYIEQRGGCDGAKKFAESCEDLREAWETCNEPGWLLTWADWHQMEGYSEALSEQYSYEAYHAALECFGSESVPMQKVIARAACARIREKLGDDPLSWLPGQSCNSIVAAEIRLTREAMKERERAAQEVAPCVS